MQGATAPFSFCIQLVVPLRHHMSGCYIEPYTYCTRRYVTSQFVCTAYGDCTALYVWVLYRTVQRVYVNSVSTRLDPMASGSYTYWTRSYRAFKFAYTYCGTCMASYVRMLYRTVQGVYKISVCTRLDTWPRDRTRTGQDATGHSSLCIHLVAPVWLMSGCCIEQYSGFTKIPLELDWT